jgi:hypothetical protein
VVIATIRGWSLALGLTASAVAGQQSPPGTIAGTVVNEVGMVVPGASVTVVDVTGAARTAVTDSRGDYRIDKLAAGSYRVRIEVAGFEPSDTASLTVERFTWHDAELRRGADALRKDADIVVMPGIAGRIKDASGGVLPGVVVTMSGPKGAQTATTTAGGTYRIDGLVPGEYAIEATLPGFRPARTTVTVTEGRVTRTNLSLRLGFFSIVDYVMPSGIGAALREADVVVHIRVTRALGVRLVNEIMIVTDFEAAVMSVVKSDAKEVANGGTLRFAQDNAGVWTEEGYRSVGGETPYAAGDSFIAFMRRNKDSSLSEYRGEAYMWPAKQGFVLPLNPVGPLPTGLRSPMPVDEAVAALRKLLSGGLR